MDHKKMLPVLCTVLLIGGMVEAAELLGNAVDVRDDARHFSDKALKETAKSRQYNN